MKRRNAKGKATTACPPPSWETCPYGAHLCAFQGQPAFLSFPFFVLADRWTDRAKRIVLSCVIGNMLERLKDGHQKEDTVLLTF